MTNPDLTAPEAVERMAARLCTSQQPSIGQRRSIAATLRSLSAALEAEREHSHKFMWHDRYACSRAEAAEARVQALADAIQDALGRYQVTHIHEGIAAALRNMEGKQNE